jgi:hypothetical protein
MFVGESGKKEETNVFINYQLTVKFLYKLSINYLMLWFVGFRSLTKPTVFRQFLPKYFHDFCSGIFL